MDWKFEEYREDSTRQDSSSAKFFKETTESNSLIREFIQNSLDAVSNSSKPVRVVINEKSLNKRDLKDFLNTLEPHLKACDIQSYKKDQKKINLIVLEDFNTKGLERENKKNFFKADNITSKSTGGGSHGIGKAVFLVVSKIHTFFGYSVFGNDVGNDESIFQGRAVLKTHKIGEKEYRPYGNLEISTDRNMDFINEIFQRKTTEKGLSVAIPYCDVKIKDIKKSCLEQFYLPVIKENLEIKIGNDKINRETILDLEFNKSKTNLVMDYVTSSENNEYLIKKEDWKNSKFPKLEKDLIEQNKPLLLSFKIELPVKHQSPEAGKVILLIKKEEDIEKFQHIDFWRDNLLISEARGRSGKQKGYTAIFITADNPLSRLLRQLEDPGHTKWQTGSIKPELKEKYKYIEKLVAFIKKLPGEIIHQIKSQPIGEDSHFFSDYFPDSSSIGREESREGINSSYGNDENKGIDIESIFQDFSYKKHKKGDGFTLKLKNKETHPDVITVKTAYGTNIGNAYKHYDERDFVFGKNITVRVDNKLGGKISCDKNCAKYSIKNKNFSISFTGFDKDKELKIDVT